MRPKIDDIPISESPLIATLSGQAHFIQSSDMILGTTKVPQEFEIT